MTPFATLRRRIGWSALEAGRRLSLSERTARRLDSGEAQLHADQAAWMERVAAAVEALPPPTRDA